jgi:hypothetical protein
MSGKKSIKVCQCRGRARVAGDLAPSKVQVSPSSVMVSYKKVLGHFLYIMASSKYIKEVTY